MVQQFPCKQQPYLKEISTVTTSSGISDQLRDIDSIYRCCWNVATYKWKVHNGEHEIISFVECREKNFNDDEIYEIKKKTSQVNVPE